MYLTEFEFNTRRRATQRTLASPHRIHAAVLSSFPAKESEEGRILWRLDHLDNGRRKLMIASPTRPDLTALNEECGWPTMAGWKSADMRRLLDSLGAGQRWAFRLTANPVRSLSRQGRRGHPVPLIGDDQVAWLEARAARVGARWDGDGLGITVTRAETLSFQRGGSRVTLNVAQFDGRLEVVDPDLLRQAMIQGVGRAKGYGCGMLSLRR